MVPFHCFAKIYHKVIINKNLCDNIVVFYIMRLFLFLKLWYLFVNNTKG